MRIVDRNTFLKMPIGTVYCKYEPFIFEELSFKQRSIFLLDGTANDFCYSAIQDSMCNAVDVRHDIENFDQFNANFQIDFDIVGRDGCFEYDQLFAVWDKPDIERLILKLQQSLNSMEIDNV